MTLNLAGLQRASDGSGFSEDEFLRIPASRLSLLLNLSVRHADTFSLHESDKKYMEGWQHALLCMQGKITRIITFEKIRN